MPTIRIYDLNGCSPGVELRDLIRLLSPKALEANWTVSAVKLLDTGHTYFESITDREEELENLVSEALSIRGFDLLSLADETRQVIWGEFVGSLPAEEDKAWVKIRAIDSTFYEITTVDEDVIERVRAAFNDVRSAEAPFG